MSRCLFIAAAPGGHAQDFSPYTDSWVPFLFIFVSNTGPWRRSTVYSLDPGALRRTRIGLHGQTDAIQEQEHLDAAAQHVSSSRQARQPRDAARRAKHSDGVKR